MRIESQIGHFTSEKKKKKKKSIGTNRNKLTILRVAGCGPYTTAAL